MSIFVLVAAAQPVLVSRAQVAVQFIAAAERTADRSAALMRTAKEEIEPFGRLSLIPASQCGVDGAVLAKCRATSNLACWATAFHDAAGSEHVRYVLLISAQPLSGKAERLTALAIDIDLAFAVYAGADRKDPNWAENAEDAIFAGAISQTKDVEIEVAPRLREFFSSLREAWKPALEKAGEWVPTGSLLITSEVPNLSVEIDGTPVATTRAGATRIADVVVGSHQVSVIDAEARYEPFTSQFSLAAGGAAAEIRASPRRVPSIARSVIGWSGAGVAAGGTSLLVYALLAPRTRSTPSLCVRGICSGGSGGFASFDDFGQHPLIAPRSSGEILVAPLGYSAIVMGSIWFAGAWLLSDEGEVPWIPFLIGIAGFGVSYGLSAAISR